VKEIVVAAVFIVEKDTLDIPTQTINIFFFTLG
jgi:hypothetical protein